jgi:hypothetical protein
MFCFIQNSIRVITIYLCSLLLLSSCVSQSVTWNYVSQNNKSKRQTNKSIQVLTMNDKRSGVSISNMKSMIPFVPFSDSVYSTIESSWSWNIPHTRLSSTDKPMPKGSCAFTESGKSYNVFKPVFHFASAVYSDILDSNISNNVSFSCVYDGNYDYYVVGDILSTEFKDRNYTYGLSVFSPVAIMFGLKDHRYEAVLKIKYYIYDKNKNIIFSKEYSSGPQFYYTTYYYSPTKLMYDTMLLEINRQFMDDLMFVVAEKK